MPTRFLPLFLFAFAMTAAEPPNILWIVFEDISPDIGAYGDPYAITPHLDKLAEQSVIYTRAFSNGGACAPARSTLITGMYPSTIGTHHMRSSGRPPRFVKGFPEYLRRAGYYCSNHSKTDYNWQQPPETWDVIDNDWRAQGWSNREPGQPFFTVINITDTHSSQTYRPNYRWPERYAALSPEERHDPTKAWVPPYYPDTPEVRQIMARNADNITFADRKVGEILAALEADGLAEDTIVFFYGDHGRGLPRSKSFTFASSNHVPLLIRFPGAAASLAPAGPGERIHRMVAFVDFAPTVLSLAGVEIPSHFHGKAFLGKQSTKPRKYVAGYRDRMDERYEFIRSVRESRYNYIRNYFPHLPWFHEQTRDYPSTNPILAIWHGLSRDGKLTGPASTYMAHAKPREMLFDVEKDPWEINNLVDDPDYRDILERLRRYHREWVFATRDLGFLPEEDMWLRFQATEDAPSAYTDVRRSPETYPLERILETADMVGAGPRHVDELQSRLQTDEDATVRFWSANGLLALGDTATAARPALRGALRDQATSVRTVAAETLCGLGECGEALGVLLTNLRHQNEYVSLRAANSLDRLGERANPVLAQIRNDMSEARYDDRTWVKIVVEGVVRKLNH